MRNVLKEKSYRFALRIVKIARHLNRQREYLLSRQLVRSGTAVGALVREAEYAQSRADFINKLSIALKEANETEYWLMLLKDSGYIVPEMFETALPEVQELIKLLISSIKTSKSERTA